MKTLLLVLLCSAAQATEFTFKYELNGTTFEIKKQEDTWEQAYQFAAQKCFDFYREKGPHSMEYGLDVIDVCANPK